MEGTEGRHRNDREERGPDPGEGGREVRRGDGQRKDGAGGGGRGAGEGPPGRTSVVDAFRRALRSLLVALPVIVGVVLLLGLFKAFVTPAMIRSVFTGAVLTDTLLGAGIGSVSAGNPITSYIIGGELLKEGVSLFAVTSFILAWVTVGLVQLPMEATFLGRRFALQRNLLAFLFACLFGMVTVLVMEGLP